MENSSSHSQQSPANPISVGCGTHSQISVHVSPTTGGDFRLTVEEDMTVENFKKIVSKRLKVPRDRLCLLFRDKQLQEGSLQEHGINDGSRVTLLPNVETGLITQRPEIGIMQALESLNDTQVNEFLCGKAPLNLSMRLGDHMMLIQLQLSTVAGQRSTTTTSSSTSTSTSSTSTGMTPTTNNNYSYTNNMYSNNNNSCGTATPSPSTSSMAATPGPSTAASTTPASSLGGSMPSIGTQTVPLSPPSLVQASRNLQTTLRRLSADVFSGKDKGRRENVYSGTFSGALNPALQDPKGRPRRDVATIVHILNDLLCSVPELRRVHHRRGITSSSTTTTSAASEETAMEAMSQDSTDVSTSSAAGSSTSCSEDQNLRTRGKLEQLRLVMGERRERRRQRKQKPYTVPTTADPPPVTDTVTA